MKVSDLEIGDKVKIYKSPHIYTIKKIFKSERIRKRLEIIFYDLPDIYLFRNNDIENGIIKIVSLVNDE